MILELETLVASYHADFYAELIEIILLKMFYNCYIMNITWDAVLGTIVGISAIISSSALGVRWLVKHYFDEIKHELKPNSGNSIKDQVTRLEKQVKEAEVLRKEMNQKIDHMYDLLISYLAK